jgi:hypothetical protein
MAIELELKPNLTSEAEITSLADKGWRLSIPAGLKGVYRLAQLDDYRVRSRRRFLWQSPMKLSLRARVSVRELPGTWGFGLWNDPFSLSVGLGGAAQRFPALPQAAWFFYASPPNYLSFRNDLPAQGFLASSFRSTPLPAPLLALVSPALPLLLWSPAVRLLRAVLRGLIQQDSTLIQVDPVNWHAYTLLWREHGLVWEVDGQIILETAVSPHGPMGLVLWIDNQYAALPPKGRLAYGFLANPEAAWIELDAIEVEKG